MAKRKTKRKRKGSVGAAFKSRGAIERRSWNTARGNVKSVKVPKACAIVQGGKKRSEGGNKGKVRKGCIIRKNGAYCDAATVDRLPERARDKRHSARSKYAYVDCK